MSTSTIWLLYTTISTWEYKGKLINSFGEDLRRFHERGGNLSYGLKMEQIHERKHIQISLNRLRIKCLQWGATKDFRMRKFKKKEKKDVSHFFKHSIILICPISSKSNVGSVCRSVSSIISAGSCSWYLISVCC